MKIKKKDPHINGLLIFDKKPGIPNEEMVVSSVNGSGKNMQKNEIGS